MGVSLAEENYLYSLKVTSLWKRIITWMKYLGWSYDYTKNMLQEEL